MAPKIAKKRLQIVALLIVAISPWGATLGQNPTSASLSEQLRAQYKTAKIDQQNNPARVLEPGTLLVIQKGGVNSVPYTSTVVCSSRYQDDKIESPDALCPEAARKNSIPFKVGEKVYPLQIEVDLKREKISLRILACDTCNGANAATPLKSEVIFQFAPGYLEKASVLEVEDTIGDVLAIDSSAAFPPSPGTQANPEGQDPNLLTNEKIAKMASVKLGDAVIVSMIKTSTCNFDTSPDAVIKLKQAGVSDVVLQAMVEAVAQPKLSDSGKNNPSPDQPPTLSGLYYMQENGTQLQLNDDGSFTQRSAKGDVRPGYYTVNGDTVGLTYDSTKLTSHFKIQGDKLYADSGRAFVRKGDVPPSEVSASHTAFAVQHRHLNLSGSGTEAYYYCSGSLFVLADGTVKYDCTQTDDPSGRCDHVSIPAGYVKEAKVGYNGALHLGTKGQGNFDFFGDAGTLKDALTAITPLIGKATSPAGAIAPPPRPPASTCGDYESCMKKAEASLELPNGGSEALGEFEEASQLEPSKGEPVAGKGYAYFAMGQYDYAIYMWDSALKLGATLSGPVCHAGMACGETGEFLLSIKEVSFVNKKGEKKFAAPPSAITSDVGTPPVIGGNGRIVAYYVQLTSSGKNYRFYLSPKGLQCRGNWVCPEPGMSQQKVFAEYVHSTLEKLRAGSFAAQPGKM